MKTNELIKQYGNGEIPFLNAESENYDLEKYFALEKLLGSRICSISNETAVLMYYGAENEKYLKEVDYVIARLLFTLQNNKPENVFLTYDGKITSASDEKAFEYLVELVEENLLDGIEITCEFKRESWDQLAAALSGFSFNIMMPL